MTKSFFIDLDGTLLDDKNKISQENLDFVFNAISKNHNVYLTTGKSEANAIVFYNQLNLESTLITSLGQVLSRPNNEEYKKVVHSLPIKCIKTILSDDILNGKVLNFAIETPSLTFIKVKSDSNLLKLLIGPNVKTQIFEDQKLEDIIGFNIEITNNDESELKTIVKELQVKHQDVTFTFWHTDGHPGILSIKPINVNKATSLQTVAKDEDLGFTISIGNGYTDAQMFPVTDVSVAMANATQRVKNYATEISESDNNNSGVARALSKYL